MLKFTSIIAKHYNREDYASINDAAKISPELAKGNTKIWYAKDGYVRTYKHNDPKTWPDPNNLAKTHVLIGSILYFTMAQWFRCSPVTFWVPIPAVACKGRADHSNESSCYSTADK